MRRQVAAALLVVGLAALASDARAYCREATPAYTDTNPVRILIHAQLDENLRHTFGNGMVACTTSATCGVGGLCVSGYGTAPTSRCQGPVWTRDELVRTVRRVVARVNDWASADLPHVYLDTTVEPTCDWSCAGWTSCFQPNTVVVIPSQVFEQAPVSSTDIRSRLVHITTSGPRPACGSFTAGPGFTWDHLSDTGGLSNHFDNALLHEIGHVIGLGHPMNDLGYPVCVPDSLTPPPSVCPSGGDMCAVMSGFDPGAFVGHNWFRDDIDGLQALYGFRSPPDVRSFEDPDITTSSFVERVTTDTVWWAQFFGVSSWTPAGRFNATMAGQIETYLDHYTWESGSGTITFRGTTTPPFESNGPIGVTETSTHRIVVTHGMRLTADARRYRRRVSIARTPLGTTSYTTTSNDPSPGSPGDTDHGGVSAAYDPASGAVVMAFRDRQSLVQLVGWNGTSWSSPVATQLRSFTQPVVACAPTTCLLVLSRAMDQPTITTSPMQWIEFGWSQTGTSASWTGNASLVNTTVWAVDADLSVSVVARVGGGYNFLITQPFAAHLGNGVFGTQVYSYVHTAGTTTLGSHLIPVVSLPGVRAPAAAGGLGSNAEVFTYGMY